LKELELHKTLCFQQNDSFVLQTWFVQNVKGLETRPNASPEEGKEKDKARDFQSGDYAK